MNRRRRKAKKDRHRAPNAGKAVVTDSGAEEPSRVGNRRWVWVPLWCLLVLATLYSSSHMNPGVDTWISLAAGRHILTHGVSDVDPFSWNSRPSWMESGVGSAFLPTGWINQKWLTHVVLAVVARTTGPDGLVVWKIAVNLLLAVMLVANARSRGAPLAVAIVATIAGLVAARDFFEIRAQEMTNLLTSALLLVLTVGTRSRPRMLWMVIPLFALWSNSHGGFVFGLVVLVVFVVVEGLTARLLPGWSTVSPTAVATVALAGIIAVAASVVLNPFHLANLTHPLIVTVSADASLWQEVAEWQPLFADGPGNVQWFVGMMLATIVVTLGVFLRAMSRRGGRRPAGEDPNAQGDLDLWSVAVVLVACLMALQSRRFVPIAAVVAVPVLAERLWALAPNAVRRDTGCHSVGLRRVVTAAAWLGLVVAAAACFRYLGGTFFGPWPASYTSTSTFDRLTHSYRRPEGLCSFLRLNEVEGHVFSPWEEAGYLEACQQPRSETGDLPVRVFIDGRAQEAYELWVLTAYQEIRFGETSGASGTASRGAPPSVAGGPTPIEIDRMLQRRTVDFVHEVREGRNGPLFRTVAASTNWVLVYADDRHELFADDRSPRGRRVVEGLRSGALAYPDDLSRAITRAENLLDSDPARSFDVAREALGPQPSPRLMELLVAAGRSSNRTAELQFLCREQVDDLSDNWERYRGRHGFGLRLLAAGWALQPLYEIAVAEGEVREQRRLQRLNSEFRTGMEDANRMVIR